MNIYILSPDEARKTFGYLNVEMPTIEELENEGAFVSGFNPPPQEHIEWLKKNYAGEGNPFYGKKHTKETKRRQASKGKKNGMYGRSMIREKNLKWYNNGVETKMFTEGEQPDDWKRGRIGKFGPRRNK